MPATLSPPPQNPGSSHHWAQLVPIAQRSSDQWQSCHSSATDYRFGGSVPDIILLAHLIHAPQTPGAQHMPEARDPESAPRIDFTVVVDKNPDGSSAANIGYPLFRGGVLTVRDGDEADIRMSERSGSETTKCLFCKGAATVTEEGENYRLGL